VQPNHTLEILEAYSGAFGVQSRDVGVGRFHANASPLGNEECQGMCVFDATHGSLRLTQRLAESLPDVLETAVALARAGKPLVWLRGQVKSPPFSPKARVVAGFLLRRLQQGETLSLPYSRPMPTIGAQCHELRVSDRDQTWRIIYHIDPDAIVILNGLQQEDRDDSTGCD